MREILFRAWDKKSKKMREIDSIAFNKDMDMFGCESVKLVNLWGYDIIEQKDIIVQREGKSFVLMEYTGLKDKNGVKIFEGDIVKFENDIEEMCIPTIGKCVFEQQECNFCLQYLVHNNTNQIAYRNIPISTHTIYLVDNPEFEYEVIGNIYDNPELLGVE